jgi:type II secretory pathway component GspD/PulD (secretin)
MMVVIDDKTYVTRFSIVSEFSHMYIYNDPPSASGHSLKPDFSRIWLCAAMFLSAAIATVYAEGEPLGTLDAALLDSHGSRLEEFKQVVAEDRMSFGKEVFVYDCKYIQASTLRRVLEEFISSDGMVSESVESDQLVLSERSDQMAVLKSIIERLDQPVPQILVEARIVELNIDSDLEKEVDLFYQEVGLNPLGSVDPLKGEIKVLQKAGSQLGVAGAAPSAGQGGIVDSQIWNNGDESLNVFLRYLETAGKAKILSAPNLIIQRGKEGSIVTGEEVPILSQTSSSGGVTTSTEFKSVGIKLSVKPTLIAGDRIRVEVNPEVSTVIGFSDAGDVSNPIIAVRQARTELEVRDGQLISMAGLLQSTDRNTERRTPFFSNIPILGSLFSSRRNQNEQTQLIIFLSIKILEFGDETVNSPDYLDPRIETEIERISEVQAERFQEPGFIGDIKAFMETGLEN